jgi:hypothetical protein
MRVQQDTPHTLARSVLVSALYVTSTLSSAAPLVKLALQFRAGLVSAWSRNLTMKRCVRYELMLVPLRGGGEDEEKSV